MPSKVGDEADGRRIRLDCAVHAVAESLFHNVLLADAAYRTFVN